MFLHSDNTNNNLVKNKRFPLLQGHIIFSNETKNRNKKITMCRRYLPGNQDPPVGLKKLNNAKAVTATKNKAQKPETFMMSLILLLTKPQEDNIIY